VDFLDWYEWLRTPSAIAWMRELLDLVDPQEGTNYPAQVAALKLKLDEANGQVKTLNDMVSKMGKQLKAATDGGESMSPDPHDCAWCDAPTISYCPTCGKTCPPLVDDPLSKLAENIVNVLGPYPYVNGTQLVADAYAALRKPKPTDGEPKPAAHSEVQP
jgi:hypothetical protein